MVEALYIHIPFCKKRCFYCDFATQACSDDEFMDAYVNALSLQIRRASRAGIFRELKTIYLGGGTPTYLGSRRLSSLVYLLSLSINLEQIEEFTLEANPDSIDERMVKDLYALGINRVSLGAQSFLDKDLQWYGRVHDVAAISDAVKAIRGRIDNFSIDLICGAQTQSLQSWKQTLHSALKTGVKHISIYPLTVENDTPLKTSIESGNCSVACDDLQADMMIAAQEILEDASMKRYEVASYAIDGYESKHNKAYWSGIPYLGLGCASSSMMSLDDYLTCLDAGIFKHDDLIWDAKQDSVIDRLRIKTSDSASEFIETDAKPKTQIETLTRQESLLEDVMLGFRMSDGPSNTLITDACNEVPQLKKVLDTLEKKKLIIHSDKGFIPSDLGWLCGNEIFASVINLAS